MNSSERRAKTFAGYSLLVVTGGREKRFHLVAGENLIGSLPGNQVVLAESGISRRHAALDVGAASVTVRDLGSKNGTFLNGRAVRSAAVLPGDVIELGKARLRIQEIDPDDAELALALSPAEGGASSSFPFRDTTQIGAAGSSGGREKWALWLEELVACLCLRPSDVHGALSLLGRELGLESVVLMENPREPSPLVLAMVGDLEEELLAAGLQACAEHLARASIASFGCSSFRARYPLPLGGSVLTAPGKELALLAVGSEPLDQEVEPILRFSLRLIGRLETGGGLAPPHRAEAPAPAALSFPSGYLPGASPVMTSLYAQMLPLLEGDLPVLIVGETGVGKEYLAKILHQSSGRSEGPFVAINCAAIPGELLEAELFGIEKGVATGVSARAGKFSQADRGTLFLDEIGDLAPHLQAKLLRALQEGEIHPVGGSPVSVDVRVVSSTNTDLKAKAEAGQFRLDLYYRLAGFTLVVPPLRERREDIPGLVQHFVQRFSEEIGKPIRGVTVKVLRALRGYDWPGNIRELEHEISRLVYACQESQPIESTLLSPYLREREGNTAPAPADPARALPTLHLAEIEQMAIERALEVSGHKLVEAARLLGISRDALRRRMDRYGLLGP